MGVTKAVRHTVRIGQVARETGLSIDTIRFYEKQGLLKHSGRTEGGFRVFGPDQIRALRFVRKAQELGFSLGEIRELLILQADEVPACCHVKELLVHKLAGVQQKIQELRSLEHGLKTALRKCERDLEASGPRQEKRCPVLEEIGRAATRIDSQS
jgi:DNA-binding transcriptional MerR regulator